MLTQTTFAIATWLTAIGIPTCVMTDDKATTDNLRPLARDELVSVRTNHIDFEVDPSGKPLVPGDDVSSTYASLGCLFATSVEDSYPSVKKYRVLEGQSCANHLPKFRGTITIQFCEPGNDEVVATISRFGIGLSFVAPGGTRVEAYDKSGGFLGHIETTKTGYEYIAFESETPISAIKIVPVEDIDPDYAFDDLIFDAPSPISD